MVFEKLREGFIVDIFDLKSAYPLIDDMMKYNEIFWINEDCNKNQDIGFCKKEIDDADARLLRFAPYIEKTFDETKERRGIIESPLIPIERMKAALEENYCTNIDGRMFLKCDSHLPVSGSIKARGGIYEVLKFAEHIATSHGMLKESDDYSILGEAKFKKLFEEYSVAVGSTGNLGLSIGIISAALGFNVTVHMSSDARKWKKDLLKAKGVKVIEYADDYQKAVAEGRREAKTNPKCHFVDDESSRDLFLGYAVAGKRLERQFKENGIIVDDEHPVFVYIPCGVGGAPGGVTYGLKTVFGKNIHCIFAEPTHAPCVTLAMMTEKNDGISVSDIGLDGKTAADGLAVKRASALVSKAMKGLIDGCFTVSDDELFPILTMLQDNEGIFIEPSACAAFPGVTWVMEEEDYLRKLRLSGRFDSTMADATHIVWATGGNMVPDEERRRYYELGINMKRRY